MIQKISIGMKGAPFLMRTAGALPKKQIFVKTGFLAGYKKKFKTYFYSPLENSSKLPGILLVHGMSVYGIDDIRLIELAKNLSASGYFVATPEFLEIQKLRIEEKSIDHIKETYHSLKEEKKLFDVERLGFFSISFSGGMGLLSLCDEKICRDVRSVLVVGPYMDFRETVPFILTNPNADEYGYFIFLYNYIDLAIKNSKELERVLFESAMDNGMHRNEKSLAPKMVEKLSKRDKEIFTKIQSEPEFRMELGKEFLAKRPDIAKNLSPIFQLGKIESPITLIHGKNDCVISAEESIKASRELSKFNRPHHLELTGLISHGDKTPILSQITEIPSLANAFGFFLTHL